MAFPVQPKLDVDVTRVDYPPVHRLGEEHTNENGTTFQYARINSTTVSPNALYQLDFANAAVSCVGGAAGTLYVLPTRFGVFQGGSPGTITSGSAGWFAVRGPMSVTANAAVTVGNPCYYGVGGGAITTNVPSIASAITNPAKVYGLSPSATTSAAGIANCFAVMNLCTALV